MRTVEARELSTITGERVRLPAPDGLTHLQFRRYAGCPICNMHLRTIAARHEEIRAAGVHEIVVFHSCAEDMLPHQGLLPFAAIADPGRRLYAEFGVETSAGAVLHPRAWTTPMRPGSWPVVARGLRRGGRPYPTGGETVLGLPADFLIDPGGQILSHRYGRHAGDQWEVDELLLLAARAGTQAGPATRTHPA